MLSYPESKQQIDEIFRLINSGRYYSLTFMKKDGSLRLLNGHKAIYVPADGSPEKEVPIAQPTKLEQGLLLVWDRNAPDYKTGNLGAYRSAKLENILIVKSGADVLDFITENDIQQRFNLSDETIDSIKRSMKIQDTIREEIELFAEELLNETSPFFGIADIPRLMMIKHPDEITPQDAQYYGKAMAKRYRELGYNDEKMIPMLKQMLGVEIYPYRHGKFSFQPVAG